MTFLLGSREIAGDADLDVYSAKSPARRRDHRQQGGREAQYTAPNGKDITVET